MQPCWCHPHLRECQASLLVLSACLSSTCRSVTLIPLHFGRVSHGLGSPLRVIGRVTHWVGLGSEFLDPSDPSRPVKNDFGSVSSSTLLRVLPTSCGASNSTCQPAPIPDITSPVVYWHCHALGHADGLPLFGHAVSLHDVTSVPSSAPTDD